MPPDSCPHCGADVPARAKVCPECGADESTGWSDEARASGLDLPDDPFEYEEFVEREFGGKKVRPRGIRWHWWVTALALAVLFLFGFLLFRR
jgi:hypothetical protein